MTYVVRFGGLPKLGTYYQGTYVNGAARVSYHQGGALRFRTRRLAQDVATQHDGRVVTLVRIKTKKFDPYEGKGTS